MLNHIYEVGCIGPLTDHELDALSNDMHVKSGLFAVYIIIVSEFFMGMAYWVEEVVTYLEENLRLLIFLDIGMIYVTSCDNMKAIIIHQDSSNEATQTQLPPMLPHGMVKLRPDKLLCKVCNQRNRLDISFPLPAHIDISCRTNYPYVD